MKKVFILFLLPFLSFAQSTLITAGGNGNVSLPKLTYTQIMAIPSPQAGMEAFDTDYGCMRIYNGTSWRCSDTPENESNVLTTAIKADAGSSVFQTYNDVFFDNSTVVVGNFSGTMTFGSTTLTSAGQQDVFMAKYDANNNLVWAFRFGGATTSSSFAGDEAVTDIVAEPGTANFYVTGRLGSVSSTGAITIPAVSGTDGFIAKFNGNGSLLWVNSFNGASTISWDGYETMSVIGNDVYVHGYQSGGTTLGSTSITAPRFIAKYNSSGVFQWAYETSGTISDIACNSSRVVVTGYFLTSIILGGTTYTSNGPADGFVLCLDNLGAFQWADTFGNSFATDAGRCILIKNNKVVIAGSYSNAMTWGNTTINSFNNNDIFLLQYNLLGNKEWIRQISGTSNFDNVIAMRNDLVGNIYILGQTGGKLWFDTKSISASSSSAITFVAKFNTDGICAWAKTYIPTSTVLVPSGFSSLALINGNPKINFSGNFNGSNVRLGHTQLTNLSGNNMFLATITDN